MAEILQKRSQVWHRVTQDPGMLAKMESEMLFKCCRAALLIPVAQYIATKRCNFSLCVMSW